MNPTNWYALSIALPIAALAFYQVGRLFRFRLWKHLFYPLLTRRRYWSRITRTEAMLLIIYFIVNGLGLGLGIREASDLATLATRAGALAMVNLIPLFLGGRTNTLSNFLNVPLQTYYLIHHWVGRMAVLQALLHVGIIVRLEGLPRTSSNTVSGALAIISILLIFMSSLASVRKRMFELFLKLHLLLAATTVIALIWHLIPRSLSLLWIPLMAVTLWLINRWCRRAVYYNKDGAEIGEIWRNEDLGIIRVKILMKDRTIMNRRFEPKPGQYYYLDFPQLPLRDRVQAHPFMLAWWTQSGSITNLTFLVEPQRGLTARLMKELSLSSVNIEGPYGQDLEVERYDTVMLVAKGVGIAGVLSYVRYLTERKSNDETVKAAEETEKMANCQRSNQQSDDLYRDHTRKIDLFWKLDHNGQAEWTSDYINELKNTWCAKKKLLLIWLCYPEPSGEVRHVTDSEENPFMEFYPDDEKQYVESFHKEIIKEARSPGKSIVVACGEPSFVERMRAAVIENTSQANIIKFAEVEFRPPAQRPRSTFTAPWNKESRPSRAVVGRAETHDTIIGETPHQIVKKPFNELREAVVHPRILQAQAEDQSGFKAEAHSEKLALGKVAAFKTMNAQTKVTKRIKSEDGVLGYVTRRSQKLPESNLKLSVITKLDKDLVKVSNVD